MILVAATANAFTITMHQLPEDPSYPRYTQAEVQLAVELVERHYGLKIKEDVATYIVEDDLLSENILAFYDFRGPLIMIGTRTMDTTLMRIYVLTHELGHHVMAGWESVDHCLMYEDEGYDHKILADLGVDNPYEKFIDPFSAMFQCEEF